MEITDTQVHILDTLNKYVPAMRLWYSSGPNGLGTIIKNQQTAIESIPGATSPIDIGTGTDGISPYLTIAANSIFSISVTVTEVFNSGATLTIGTLSTTASANSCFPSDWGYREQPTTVAPRSLYTIWFKLGFYCFTMVLST